MLTDFSERSLESSRCLLMEALLIERIEKAKTEGKNVCWYDVCADGLFVMEMDKSDLEMWCREYRWTQADIDKLKLSNGNCSPIYMYMGYLQMFDGSINPIDLKIRTDMFEAECLEIGYVSNMFYRLLF